MKYIFLSHKPQNHLLQKSRATGTVLVWHWQMDFMFSFLNQSISWIPTCHSFDLETWMSTFETDMFKTRAHFLCHFFI